MAELFRGHRETLTSCCAAWSGCPSRALAGPRRRGPIAVTTCWPAAPPEKRQRPRRLLSSSRRRSVPGRCPASSRSQSSEAGTIHVESPPHTHRQSHSTTRTHLYLLADVFGLGYKAEVEAFGFSRQQAHALLGRRLHHTPLVVFLHTHNFTHKTVL